MKLILKELTIFLNTCIIFMRSACVCSAGQIVNRVLIVCVVMWSFSGFVACPDYALQLMYARQ